METERLQILTMLEEKKISAEEAGRLLDAMGQPIAARGEGTAKWLRIRVLDLKTHKAKVNINLPMALVDIALNVGMKFIPEVALDRMGGVDIKQLLAAIKEGAVGRLVEVDDEEEGVRVEIIVE